MSTRPAGQPDRGDKKPEEIVPDVRPIISPETGLGPRDIRKGDRWLPWHFEPDFDPKKFST